MPHPCETCAMANCCFCLDLHPNVTCAILAAVGIISCYAGFTNFGFGPWALYFISLVNLFLHLVSCIMLFLGSVWGINSVKKAYAWMALLGIITLIIGLALFFILNKNRSIIWGKTCHDFNETLGTIIVFVHVLWMTIFDVYSALVVMGNLEVENLRRSCSLDSMGCHVCTETVV